VHQNSYFRPKPFKLSHHLEWFFLVAVNKPSISPLAMKTFFPRRSRVVGLVSKALVVPKATIADTVSGCKAAVSSSCVGAV
jgi:hypothetical protein